ncbi:MAG TPA: hypothetical protein VMT20_15355 [Terriglobia bacterium]|nr:hypothetical protein [Terriglobia bacterium]
MKILRPVGRKRMDDPARAGNWWGPDGPPLVQALSKGKMLAVYETHVAVEVEKAAGARRRNWLRVDKRDWGLVEAGIARWGRLPRLLPGRIHARMGWTHGPTRHYLDRMVMKAHGLEPEPYEEVGYVNFDFYDVRLLNLEAKAPGLYLKECALAYRAEVAEEAKRQERQQKRLRAENRQVEEEILRWAGELGALLQEQLKAEALPKAELTKTTANGRVKCLTPATFPDTPEAPKDPLDEAFPTTLAPARGQLLDPNHRSYMNERADRAEDNSKRRDSKRVAGMGG